MLELVGGLAVQPMAKSSKAQIMETVGLCLIQAMV